MNTLKVNTPEELHQAISKFLQSDYSRENLIVVYEYARKCANRFRVTYSALPKVPCANSISHNMPMLSCRFAFRTFILAGSVNS